MHDIVLHFEQRNELRLCIDNFSAPKPECTTDPECPDHLACVQEKCKDPCYSNSCGRNAKCKAKNHRAICVCIYGYVGDPYTLCEERKINVFCSFVFDIHSKSFRTKIVCGFHLIVVMFSCLSFEILKSFYQ